MTAAPHQQQQTHRRAAVYRLYDDAGHLLYIGSAYDPEERQGYHKHKAWGSEIARREDRWYHDRAMAYTQETAAIEAERPKYNVIDNPVVPSARSAFDPDNPEAQSEAVRRVMNALEAADGITDPEARSRAQALITAMTRGQSARWNAERGDLARGLKAKGVSVRGIAKRLGVEPGTIQDLLSGYRGSGRDRPLTESPSARRAPRRGVRLHPMADPTAGQPGFPDA